MSKKKEMTLRPVYDCSENQVESACNLLHMQWPRGGTVDDYKTKLNLGVTKTTGLPCSYLLLREDVVVGHGRLIECFEGSGGNAAAATYVIAEPRGKGYGSFLMKNIEDHAKLHGYHYLYIWTASAVPFYEKNGYSATERVSLNTSCLKTLAIDQVSKLEHMLSKKYSTECQETILLPPDAMNKNDVWMRKRLRECVGSVVVPLKDRFQELNNFISQSVPDSNLSLQYEFRLLEIPWQKQVGPSCGLAALRMLRDHYAPDIPYQPSLLKEAQEKGYSFDGEIFDARDLVKLADFCGLNSSLLSFQEESPVSIVSIIRSCGTVIIPYDSQSSTKLPCQNAGHTAHYGIIVGMLFGYKTSDPIDTTHIPVLNKCSGSHRVEDAEHVWLLVQHGLQQKLSIASYDEFFESNKQLYSPDDSKFSPSVPMHLKNCLIQCTGAKTPMME